MTASSTATTPSSTPTALTDPASKNTALTNTALTPGGQELSAVRLLIAETLDLDPDEVTSTLRLHDVPEWSSLDHVTLMLALEERLGRTIDGPLSAQLLSVAAIEAWAAGQASPVIEVDPAVATTPAQKPHPAGEPVIRRGLDGVFIDTSAITDIDGTAGRLAIRGYDITELAEGADLIDVFHLVLLGARPDESQRANLVDRLLDPPALPPEVAEVADRLVERHPMVVLRTCLSLLGDGHPEARVRSATVAVDRGLDLVGWSYQILARQVAADVGREPPWSPSDPIRGREAVPSNRWPAAHRFLVASFGVEPDPIEAEALDLAWRLQVDHGSNASAFAARVTAAAGTDVDAAIVAGLATFAGGLHGGAVQGVMAALREIGPPERAGAWVEDRRARREPVMGYGHRVYKVADPRSAPLRTMARRLADHRGDRWALDLMAAVEQAMAPYERAGLGMNVDSYSAVIYHLLGFPDRFHTSLYAAARMIGWVAHVAEQVETNVLIRPRLAYTGPARRPWAVDAGTVDAGEFGR